VLSHQAGPLYKLIISEVSESLFHFISFFHTLGHFKNSKESLTDHHIILNTGQLIPYLLNHLCLTCTSLNQTNIIMKQKGWSRWNYQELLTYTDRSFVINISENFKALHTLINN